MNKPNPELFRKMSEPFESVEEANKAIVAFFEEVGELRKKHGLENVYFIISGTWKTEEGEGQFIVPQMYGNPLMAESLTAFAYGREQCERQERIGELLAKGIKMGKKKP